MKILYLPLKAEWYNLIESGVKTEEYRQIKPFYIHRLSCIGGPMKYLEQFNYDEHLEVIEANIARGMSVNVNGYTHVQFSYGYTKRTMLFQIDDITVGYGKTEWGAPEDEKVFIIKLGARVRELAVCLAEL
jgi:hypothetical protein